MRNYLLYARAAEVRKGSAPDTADETISKLSIAKVRLYLELPEKRRDEWLDRDGSIEEANAILAEAGKKTKGSKDKEETRPATNSSRTSKPTAPEVGNEPENEPDESVPVDGEADEDGDESDQAAAGEGEKQAATSTRDDAPQSVGAEQPSEPYSPTERELVEGVLRSYKNARPLVRNKILAGLGAYPDAVVFFSQMIENGN